MNSYELKVKLVNHVVKSTVNVIMEDKDTEKPMGTGTGGLIVYQNRLFFISVQHVTDRQNLVAVIDTGIIENGKRAVYKVGQLNYIDQYKVFALGEDDQEIKFLETIDITYGEIRNTDFFIRQKEVKFGDVVVTEGYKRLLFTDLNEKPDKKQGYAFYGRIRSSFKDNLLQQTDKLILGMKYDTRLGDFERFLLTDVITDEKDFKGLSGAPIIGEIGEPVAFLAHGFVGKNHIYGFSVRELRKYLSIYIDTNPLS